MKLIIDTVEDTKADVLAAVENLFSTRNEKIEKAIKKNAGKGKRKKAEAEAEPKEDAITKDQIRKALEAYKEENGMKGVKDILTKYGSNLSEVDESDYADLLSDLALD